MSTFKRRDSGFSSIDSYRSTRFVDKIKIKVHTHKYTVCMWVDTTTRFNDFMENLKDKVDIPNNSCLIYYDMDHMVSIIDQEDFFLSLVEKRNAQSEAQAIIPSSKATTLQEFNLYLDELQIRAYDSLTLSQLTAIMYSALQTYKKRKTEIHSNSEAGRNILKKLRSFVDYAKMKQKTLQLNNPVSLQYHSDTVTEFGISTTKQSLLLLLEWTYYNITNLHPSFSQAKFLSTATNLNDNQLENWFENMRIAIQLCENPLTEIKLKIFEINPAVCLQPYQNEPQILKEIKEN
ncbi:hypothetical protein HDV06_001545 [Boothiomyces sp. JEL0866]|nr:hypothetical protein HDV06_001545 [Boothiomyces sp. JEL0866]